MPVSRSGKLYVTKDQIEQASKLSALEYAQDHGYDLVKDGHSYYLRNHDSMIFTADGRWFWNSKGYAGRALQFLLHYEKKSLPDAVTMLLSAPTQAQSVATPNTRQYTSPVPSSEKKPFELPARAGDFRRLFAYLCYTRGLDQDIVRSLIDSKRLYQSVRGNAVFLGLDEAGKPRNGFQRGLNTYGEKPFKRDVAGSEKLFAFCLPGQAEVNTVEIFEAAIDAISHASASILLGEDYRDRDRIALGGVSSAPLIRYLKHHPNVKHIIFGLDNDKAGQPATARITAELQGIGYTADRGYRISIDIPPQGKDWNDSLLWMKRQLEDERMKPPVQEGDLIYINNTPCKVKSASRTSVEWCDVNCPIALGCTTAEDFVIRLRADNRNSHFFALK